LQRFILFIIYAGFLILPATAQNPRLNKVLWSDNLKLEIKTGAMTIMSPVPEKYLAFTNNLNVPIEVPGMLGIFSAKRSVSPHLEVGYQLDYLRVQGQARDADNAQLEVQTQILTHCFQGQYNFKRNDVFKPLFNYFVYYKMGEFFMSISCFTIPAIRSTNSPKYLSGLPIGLVGVLKKRAPTITVP